ncbi:hypothetical protein EXT67_21235 [Pectobacterium atrosepticum]|uniref:Uncharacterized protein n=1 Tax=Pectobacterium phage phiTE TaxID=1116482 RepID=K9L4D6_9CAUD|nr:hypothetical protein [Pectobacterium atrosepticum]YP_007392644.1 transcriptional regulator [Pectobacterium phage phiTE]AEZ66348.1 hypothetical protein phiTE_182 [Pectobacterium phage phiTE]ARB11682.1 hypothetical protein CB7_229 [Pectobacterium phage vB_PatM_CB7]MCL6318819.1 hypothetical protein [Pectobacterium atrosepticum]
MAKTELIKTLPSDIETRKRLANIVQEGVDAIRKQKDAAEDLKSILSITKEDLNIDPKFLRTLINGEYDKQDAAEKKRAALEDQIEQLNELDILMGRERVEGE